MVHYIARYAGILGRGAEPYNLCSCRYEDRCAWDHAPLPVPRVASFDGEALGSYPNERVSNTRQPTKFLGVRYDTKIRE